MTDVVETATVVMLVVTGQNDKLRWFRFRPGFFLPEFTIEWLPDTMIADGLPRDLAGVLIKKGYARELTEEELTAPAPAAEPVVEAKASTETDAPSRRSRKGEHHDQSHLQ